MYETLCAVEPLDHLRVCMMIGRQAGILGLLATMASKHEIMSVVPYDAITKDVAKEFGIPIRRSISAMRADLRCSNVLLSVHGRQIVKPDLLALPNMGAWNVHPCLNTYPGKEPIKRLLADHPDDREIFASVAMHKMAPEVDAGEVLLERQCVVNGHTVSEIYNELYPLYVHVIRGGLNKILSMYTPKDPQYL